MYDELGREVTHASLEEILHERPDGASRIHRQSRVEKFFKAVGTGDLETVTRFTTHLSECIEWVDKESKRAIHIAVINKQYDVCRYLLESDLQPNVNIKDRLGRTPLRYAAANEDEEIVKLLIANGAETDMTNQAGNTVLGFASSKGYTSICRILIEIGKADPNHKNHEGHTPLHHASANGFELTCQLLLDASADPNATNLENRSPLHRAALNNYFQLCQLLLTKGADPNIQVTLPNTPEDGFTPLHYATSKGNVKTCDILLSGGADPNKRSKDGTTPLLIAQNHRTLCKLLLFYKADPNLAENRGLTPLHFACRSSDEHICKILLESTSTDVNVQDQNGSTPLMYSVRQSDSLLCKILLHYKADPNQGDNRGKTALHYASETAGIEICQLLLDNGANPNSTDMNGNTSLHAAAKQQSEVLELLILLVEKGAKLTAKNKYGKTPKDLGTWGRDEELLIKKAVQRREYNNLLSQGNKAVDVVKLFYCGDPKAGKTTLKNSLTKKQQFLTLRNILPWKSPQHAVNTSGNDDSYDSTPGIDVAKETIPKTGQFSMWDCAGQLEYHITHAMFMGVENSIFTVTYDISRSMTCIDTTWKRLKYWLSFIRAGHSPRQHSKPIVVLVASHLDQCQNKKKAFENAEKLLKASKEQFSRSLDICSQLVVVDARLSSDENMDILKDTLGKTSRDIRGTKTIPTLCEKITSLKNSWGREDYPVLPWSEYYQKVKGEIDSLVTEDFLKVATSYLHDMGEVYFAELPDKEHQVILNTKWLSYDIIGAAFAGENFPGEFKKLRESRVYDRNQLQQFFKTSADIDLLVSLLQHIGLLYKCGEEKYVIPGKLPESLDKVSWRKEEEFKEYHGRRIKCKKDIDMFAPDVFPCIQTRIMEEFHMIDEPAAISRTTVKFAVDTVEGMVQQSRDKCAISIACRCRGEEDRGSCHEMLEKVTRLVKLELMKKSPGTQTELFYLSPRSLSAHDDLEDVWHYREEDLRKGEEDGHNSVKDRATRNTDKISSVLCFGYDSLFLQWFRLDCNLQWVPHTVKKALYRCLDVKSPQRQDYRSLADVLDISTAELQHIEQSSSSSPTEAIINRFCEREQTKMTLRNLHGILSHPGLVDNEGALKILDDLLTEKAIETPETIDSISTCMPAVHIAWRSTLRQCWDDLRADIKPSDLLHPFLSVDDEQLVLAEETSHGQRKANDVLLNCLLQRRDWYADFLTSLRGKSAGVGHLANMLEKTHKQVWKALPVVKFLREMYLLAWNRVMKNKWIPFRTTIVPHDLISHLPFLSEEDKESILDLEEELGLPPAADILHTIIRDTSDPTYFKFLMSGLRASGFTNLADMLLDELTTVLKDDTFKYLREQLETLFPL